MSFFHDKHLETMNFIGKNKIQYIGGARNNSRNKLLMKSVDEILKKSLKEFSKKSLTKFH